MGIDLFFSNQLEHFAKKLARNIDGDHHLSKDPALVYKANLKTLQPFFLNQLGKEKKRHHARISEKEQMVDFHAHLPDKKMDQKVYIKQLDVV